MDIVGQVLHPGRTENEVIDSMLAYHTAYNQERHLYDYFPFNGKWGLTDYNSGSYYRGLGEALNLQQPDSYFDLPGMDAVVGQDYGKQWKLPGTQNVLPTPIAYPSTNSYINYTPYFK